jgi:hypothetical protein
MLVASRHMPKFTRRPLGLAGWLLIVCLFAVVVYLAVMRVQALLLVLSGFAMLFWFARQQSQREARKLKGLASQRVGQTICEFVRDFDARALDTWVIRAVYEQLQGQLQHVHPSFPVRADDRLKEDLMLDDDDLNMDLAHEIEIRTGRSIDNSASNPSFGKVLTVRDLVHFFQNQPKSSSATSPPVERPF